MSRADWSLANASVLIKGAVRGAIYDLAAQRVFWLNGAALDVLEGKKANEDFWEQLAGLGVAGCSGTDMHSPAGQSAPSVRLEFLWLELNSQCNLSCIHCYASSSPDRDASSVALTSDHWLGLVDEASRLGCRSIQFTGGEPLVRSDLFELASFARERGIENVELFTNATLLSQRHVMLMKELGMSVAVSFYSSDPKTHDSITNTRGSHARTVAALRMLSEAHVPARVAITVMKRNQETMPQTMELLRQFGCEDVQADVVRPVGRGASPELIPDASLAHQWCSDSDTGFSVDQSCFERNRHWNPCWAGKAVVTETGDVLPCVFARDLAVGNVQESSLEAIVSGEELRNLWRINKDSVDVCNNCEFRYACTDCRVLAKAETGNILAKSPRCSYDPLSGRWSD